MYIRNLKYAHLTSVSRQHNIHLVSSTCQHKYKWILCTEKPILNASFQDFWCTNINNHLFCFKKTITTYLKAKNSPHATRISSFKCVFIVFFETKQMLKYKLHTRKLCILQTFHASFLTTQHFFCEFTTQKHKFKRWFCTQKPVLIVRFKDFWLQR